MNFTKIDGVDVTVRVNDADEARHALKELRLARKQTLHEKRGLARDLKEAEAREEKPAKRRRSRGEIVESPGGYVWRSLVAVAKLATGQDQETERRPEPEERKPPTAASLERQIAAANALIHNLDAVILEIEARLLKEKAKRS
jgi:hypothetical protein